jgi:transcriptional regulator with XRE-family HTH domain
MNIDRQFYQLGHLVKEYRRKSNISQIHLAKKLGYKNGQFVSNMERGLCNVPFSKVGELAKELNIPTDIIIDRMAEDFKANIRDTVELSNDEKLSHYILTQSIV